MDRAVTDRPDPEDPARSVDPPPIPDPVASLTTPTAPIAAPSPLPGTGSPPDPAPRPDTAAAANPDGRRRRPRLIAASVALVAILGGSALFISGYSLGRQALLEPGTPEGAEAAFQPFWDTYQTISDRYAGGTVSQDGLVDGAIKGMIDSLHDPYSEYLTGDQYRSNLQGISGQFEGIGADIATSDATGAPACTTLGSACRLIVTRPIDGSPAARAGLLPGDVVLSVDGASVDGLTADDALGKIRGPKGTVVTLSVQRGPGAPISFRITRDIVQQPEVTTKVLAGGTIGYIRMAGFSDVAADQVVDALRADLIADRHKLILDLRGNPGGYVTAARKVASQFIKTGVLFWEVDAQGNPTATEALGDGVATDPSIQLVVLIDHGSASASEIVAGALQDTGRATLVGQVSYGKGTIQQWQELSGNGGAFKLTVARWLTPDKRSIHQLGLTPDDPVTLPSPVPPGTDPTLDRAVHDLAGSGAGTGWQDAG
jgi:carboxyl-terminal processing protease